jgi:hypothetical protein
MYVWILVAAIMLSLVLLYLARSHGVVKESFITVDLDTATTQRQMLQFEGERRYNPLARLQVPTNLLSDDQVNAALQQEIPVPTSGTKSLMTLLGFTSVGATDDGSNKVGTTLEQTGVLQQKIDFCEALTDGDCDKLDDPRYAECGICLIDGRDSKGKKHKGGLFISSDDQIRANEVSNANGWAPAKYKPTIGKCKPENFSLMSEVCQANALRLGCQIAGGATSNNPCGQCYGSASPLKGSSGLLYVGPKPRPFTCYLNVSHPGGHAVTSAFAGLVVTYPNGAQASLTWSPQTLLDPKQLTLEVFEGMPLTIGVVGMPAVWCAWLSDLTGNRVVSVDIGVSAITPAAGFSIAGDKRSAAVTKAMANEPGWAAYQATVPNTVMWYMRKDEVVPGIVTSAWYGTTLPSASSPGIGVDVTDTVKWYAGNNSNVQAWYEALNVGDPAPGQQKYLWVTQDNGKMVSAPGDAGGINAPELYNAMQLTFQVPATLVDPLFTQDMAACPSGPMVFTEIGAGLMGSHSCFKPDGSFNPNLYCIQELFTAAGGTPQGTIYPTTEAQAKALALNDASGNPSLDATTAAFNNGVNIATYGVDSNNAPHDFAVIKANALNYLGVVMNNPCDGPTSTTGPHDPDCLDYLWRTARNPEMDGSTSDPSKIPYLTCSQKGSSAPLNADGSINQANVTAANQQGGVAGVRAYYQGLYNQTNSSDFPTQALGMRQCFGANLNEPAPSTSDCPIPNPNEWQCFGPTKLKQPEVFNVGPGGYATTQADAPALCASYGATVATTAQLNTAYQQGAEWCGAGWVSDSTTNAPYPMQTAKAGCSNAAGVQVFGTGWLPSTDSTGANKNGNGNPATAMATVNCYGKKPPSGTANVAAFNEVTGAWYNPNSLPPGISDNSVILGIDMSDVIGCAGPDNNSCGIFGNEDACEVYLTATNGGLNQTGGVFPFGDYNPVLAQSIATYLQARV